MLVWEKNISLAKYSTFQIGGNAKLFCIVNSYDEMRKALSHVLKEKMPYFIVGKGSNTLFDDKGFDGAIICNRILFLHREESFFSVGSGYSFSLLGQRTAKLGYSGLEYAAGIPATLGGAVYMNAGANNQKISDVVVSVDYLNEKGEICKYKKKDLTFSYRYSSFHEKKGAILSATIKLEPFNKARDNQLCLLEKRRKSQPGSDQSAGCIFRNPEKKAAGQLIEEMGLKGMRVGGAMVSDVHGNFIVNKGGATSKDVLELVEYIHKKAKEEYNINLQREIRYLPYHGRIEERVSR